MASTARRLTGSGLSYRLNGPESSSCMDGPLGRLTVLPRPNLIAAREGGHLPSQAAPGAELPQDAARGWAGKLIAAQEEERTRISRELHDGVNQQAAMLAVELGILARELPDERHQLRQKMLKIRDQAEALSNDIRRVSHQLHPAILELVGLVPALRSQCREFEEREGVRTEFTVDSGIANVPMEVALPLYRVTQEALRNVAKHARATQVRLKLMQRKGSILLVVSDNGKGFNTEQLRRSTGLGHISMLERARLVGGTLTIRSRGGAGTEVMVQMPLPKREGE